MNKKQEKYSIGIAPIEACLFNNEFIVDLI